MIDQKLLGKKIWVLDGAMDTMLLAGGVEDPDPERVNLTHPAVVADKVGMNRKSVMLCINKYLEVAVSTIW